MKARTRTAKAWFRPIRGSYLPAAWQGLALYFVYMAYLIALGAAWYDSGHTLWRLVTTVVPLALAAVALTQYVAGRHSR